jgi:hypothetical protein
MLDFSLNRQWYDRLLHDVTLVHRHAVHGRFCVPDFEHQVSRLPLHSFIVTSTTISSCVRMKQAVRMF